MTEAEALRVLTGTRDEIDKKSQNQRREREANYESNKHY